MEVSLTGMEHDLSSFPICFTHKRIIDNNLGRDEQQRKVQLSEGIECEVEADDQLWPAATSKHLF